LEILHRERDAGDPCINPIQTELPGRKALKLSHSAFGVEVVNRLAQRHLPGHACVVDGT